MKWMKIRCHVKYAWKQRSAIPSTIMINCFLSEPYRFLPIHTYVALSTVDIVLITIVLFSINGFSWAALREVKIWYFCSLLLIMPSFLNHFTSKLDVPMIEQTSLTSLPFSWRATGDEFATIRAGTKALFTCCYGLNTTTVMLWIIKSHSVIN